MSRDSLATSEVEPVPSAASAAAMTWLVGPKVLIQKVLPCGMCRMSCTCAESGLMVHTCTFC